MTQAINSIWEAIKKVNDIYSEIEDSDIIIDTSDEKKNAFDRSFRETYRNIKSKYMRKDVVALDRHKVAAIIICTIIEEDIVSSSREADDYTIFLGAEMVALSVGLSYMQRSLNELLQDISVPKIINGYHMPTAMACKTDYFDILARNLYFSRKYYTLNPLDIADKLFLIEYVTLQDEMIDPRLLLNAANLDNCVDN